MMDRARRAIVQNEIITVFAAGALCGVGVVASAWFAVGAAAVLGAEMAVRAVTSE